MSSCLEVVINKNVKRIRILKFSSLGYMFYILMV